MFLSVLHQHYKMRRRSICQERTLMVILMTMTLACLFNSLVLLGSSSQHRHDHDTANDQEFTIGKYHVDGHWDRVKDPHRITAGLFIPDKHYNLFRNNKNNERKQSLTFKKQQINGPMSALEGDDNYHKDGGGGGAVSTTSTTTSTLRSQWESTHTYQTEPMKRIHYPTIIDNSNANNSPSSMIPYDVHDCPKTHLPESYPTFFNASTILSHWNVDTISVPTDYHYGSLCIFDWTTDYDSIQFYQRNEVPFVVIRHPELYKTVQRWSDDEYLIKLIGNDIPQRTEYSVNNHLMYWKSHGVKHDPKDYVPPTEDVMMTFREWKQKADHLVMMANANATNNTNTNAATTNTNNAPHWYLRYNAAKPHVHPDLYQELPFFDPSNHRHRQADFLVDTSEERGINCRFGMAGGIAEAHFDPTRNWILHLGGTGPRRYILAHPSQCHNFMLYPQNHPSGRHASINWSTEYNTEPFASAQTLETILQPSDALYLPTSWLHFIVALGTNYQCNARSGMTTENRHHIQECGFAVPM